MAFLRFASGESSSASGSPHRQRGHNRPKCDHGRGLLRNRSQNHLDLRRKPAFGGQFFAEILQFPLCRKGTEPEQIRRFLEGSVSHHIVDVNPLIYQTAPFSVDQAKPGGAGDDIFKSSMQHPRYPKESRRAMARCDPGFQLYNLSKKNNGNNHFHPRALSVAGVFTKMHGDPR